MGELLGCQSHWASKRLLICTVHHRLAAQSEGLGMLPVPLLRRILDFEHPETPPVQREVASSLPPHVVPTEVAIVLGHILWSCPRPLWDVWGPLAVLIVETTLSAAALLNEPDKDQIHHAGIVLTAVCGRQLVHPVEGLTPKLIKLGRTLKSTVGAANGLEGFIKHRATCAVEAARELEVHHAAVRIQSAWRGRAARRARVR